MRWMCVHGEPLFQFGYFGDWIDECSIAFASFIVAKIESTDAALAKCIWAGVGQQCTRHSALSNLRYVMAHVHD